MRPFFLHWTNKAAPCCVWKEKNDHMRVRKTHLASCATGETQRQAEEAALDLGVLEKESRWAFAPEGHWHRKAALGCLELYVLPAWTGAKRAFSCWSQLPSAMKLGPVSAVGARRPIVGASCLSPDWFMVIVSLPPAADFLGCYCR